MYNFFKRYIEDDSIFFSLLIILIGVSSFGLGRWSMAETVSTLSPTAAVVMTTSETPARNTANDDEKTPSSSISPEAQGAFVASKNGSKYHLPYCPGAQQMNEENKIWFNSKKEAEAKGYTAAANCPGL